eukprot:Opistho-2@75908
MLSPQTTERRLASTLPLKKLEIPGVATARVQLWDIAGQERVNNMTRIYYKDASAGIVVFDQTRWHTFNAVKRWKRDIDSKLRSPDGSPFPVILVANKADLPNSTFATKEALDAFCQENGFMAWYDVSAKTNLNIEESFGHLVRHVVEAGSRSPMSRLSVGASECGKIDLCGYSDENEGKRSSGCCSGGSFFFCKKSLPS